MDDDIETKDQRILRQRAAEASRLMSDPFLTEALSHVLADTRDELETCPTDKLLELQGTARGIRGLLGKLEEAIITGTSLPKEPTSNDPGNIV